jgi:hypothetical protein
VEVNGRDLSFQVKELKPPHGQDRVTKPEDWERAGLVDRRESPVEK